MNVLIFGAGGYAKEIIDLIEDNTTAKIIGLIDKNGIGSKVLGHEILGSDQEVKRMVNSRKVTHFFVAIGDIITRERVYKQTSLILKPLNIISKKAYISKYAKLGNHVVVFPGVVINSDVEIGNNVIVNTNSAIGHEVKIGNNVNINPGASIAGKVRIGEFSTVGIGASIKENLTIMPNTLIGAGAVVVKNTISGNTYIGVPARIKK